MLEIVPIVPENLRENGNTNYSPPCKKQISPALRWCFTFNNYPSDWKLEIVPKFQNLCNKFVIGEEIGEEGTPHLQGSVWLKKKARPSSLGFSNKIHWEPMRNEEASLKYCQKDNKFVSFGLPKPIKIIDSLRPWQLEIENLIINNEPDGRSINWYWESEGNFGKSSFCKYMYIKHKTLIIRGGKLADVINIIFNANMDEISSVIIDIPRKNKNNVSYNAIECILDGLITNTKFETGIKVFNPPHVIVFSNFPPEEDNEVSADRWKITKLR